VASARAEGLRPVGVLVDLKVGEEKEFLVFEFEFVVGFQDAPLRRRMDLGAGEEGAGDEVPFL